MPKSLSTVDSNNIAVKNVVFENLSAAPSSPIKGRVYFDTVLNVLRSWNGTVWVSLVPLVGAFANKGNWNASTNTPALVSGVGNNGDIYTINVAGTTTLDGVSNFAIGDEIFFDGTLWQHIDNTIYVTSTQLATKTGKFATDIGDNSATSIVVTHNLNTRDILIRLRNNSAPFDFQEPDFQATTVNTATLLFSTAPTAAQYRAIVVG